MKKKFAVRQLFHSMCTAGLLLLSSNAMASAFQLWEQDAASVGDYHSGRAAQANDASTAYYNPAGIIRIDHQQLILGDVAVLSNIQYNGTVSDGVFVPAAPPFFPGITIPNPPGVPTPVVSQGGSFTQIPNFHYVAPITERLGFGISLVAPFGLRTVYGTNTRLRYAATTTQIEVVDLAPSLGFAVTKYFSIGAGLDYERMAAEFDNVAESGFGTSSDTTSTNKGHSYGWGYHLGALFEISPATRVGIAYHSQVRHHIRGTSSFEGFIANVANGGTLYNANTLTDVTLPATTTLSIFHQVNPRWDVKATAIYTQWNIFQNLTISNVSGVFVLFPTFATTPSTTLILTAPEHYHNTWNVSVGTDYSVTDQLILRGGVGYDQSPVQNVYRDVQVPDANRVAVAFGGHYQAFKSIGFDLGYTHLFMVSNATINPPTRIVGAQSVTTNGSVKASADIFAASLTWDFA